MPRTRIMNGYPPRGEYRCHTTNPDTRPHLLMVEDDAALSQTLIHTVMTHLSAMKVTAVSAVEQAWPILEEGDVSLLITDLTLPGIQGCYSFNASGNGGGTGRSSSGAALRSKAAMRCVRCYRLRRSWQSPLR